MDSALEQVLKGTNLEGHVIVYDETRQWPEAEREAIFRLGILRRIEDAEYLTCDACGDPHDAEVIMDLGPEPRIYCGAVGLMSIRPERLRQWEVDFAELARLLSAELQLVGGIQPLMPGRLWFLGRKQVAERVIEFFLVRGIAWPDGKEILRAAPRLQSAPAPVILCPDRLPQDPEWQQNGRALFRLTEFVRLKESRLVVEFEALADLHRQVAARVEEPLVPTPVPARPDLIRNYCRQNNCLVKDVHFWANVAREDLNKWKLGRPSVPDGGEKAIRIEKLLQRGQKTRT